MPTPTLTSATIREIAALTRINSHGDAYVLAARALGVTELVDTFVHINREHERLGHLSIELSHSRRTAYESLMAHARQALPVDTFKALYSAT